MQASCDAVSCLTEPFYFLGDDRYLLQVAAAVDVPVLRKDFFIDEYMIYEAKLFGASAILLIVSLLDDKTLTTYMEVADSLGLSALVECRDSTEVDRAVSAGARIIGVNNRNLGTFEVDMERTARLRDLVPGDTILVSESGISSGKDCARLRSIGVDAVLVGEALVRSSDKAALIRELKRGGSLDGHQDFGLRRHEDILFVNELDRNMSFRHRRALEPQEHRCKASDGLVQELDDGIVKVGVFVDESLDFVSACSPTV
jgi:indole-3-glycerol phosphate synthase